MRYYVDTCIWMDFFLRRREQFDTLLTEIIHNKDTLLFSDLLIKEIITQVDADEFYTLITHLQTSIPVDISLIKKELFFTASVLSRERKIPHNDCVHALFTQSQYGTLITRDSHFLLLQDICPILFL